MCMTAPTLKGPGGPLLNHSGRFLLESPMCTSIAWHSDVVHWAIQTYFRTLGVRISNLQPWTTKKAARIMLCFPVISLLQQPVLFSFPQSDKCMLPSKAEGKEKIDMNSPSCICPPNATNLAFRLLAPLIRKPLRNFCQVSVHSFSLMKHQVSFTNNSCHIQALARPAQQQSLASAHHCSGPCLPEQETPRYSGQCPDTVCLQELGETKGIRSFQGDTMLSLQRLTWDLGM